MNLVPENPVKTKSLSPYKANIIPNTSIQTKSNQKNISSIQLHNNQGRSTYVDYHSMKPSYVLDLLSDHNPKVRNQLPFIQEYKKRLSCGFGLGKGQFTNEAQMPKVRRQRVGRADVIRNSILLKKYSVQDQPHNKKHLKDKISKINMSVVQQSKEESFSFHKQTVRSPNTPSRPLRRKKHKTTNSSKASLDLEAFEEKIRKPLSPFEQRKMYEI